MVPRFDLVDIVKTLQQKLRFIIIVTIAAAVLGAASFLIRKKEYKAKTEFFTANPYYIDRTNLFRSDYSQFIDYFAKEDDVDKVMAIAKSDSLQLRVIRNLDLGKWYGKDANDPKQLTKLMEIFDGKYEVKRTEYTSIEVTYTDEDAKLSSDVANEIVKGISDMYSGYFNALRNNVKTSLEAKVKEIDSTIIQLTDSLSALRDRYQFYDLISPSRKNIITGSVHSNVAGFGRGVEEIQNAESIKDQLVMDRAGYITNINEFTTGTKAGALPLINTISRANVPYKPMGFTFPVTVAVCALVGLFFVSIWVLLITYFRAILNTER